MTRSIPYNSKIMNKKESLTKPPHRPRYKNPTPPPSEILRTFILRNTHANSSLSLSRGGVLSTTSIHTHIYMHTDLANKKKCLPYQYVPLSCRPFSSTNFRGTRGDGGDRKISRGKREREEESKKERESRCSRVARSRELFQDLDWLTLTRSFLSLGMRDVRV